MLETSHPPTYYLRWGDVAKLLLEPALGASFCEWKGPARFRTLVAGKRRLPGVAWSYPNPLPGATLRPQPGGFYGGWITPKLVGPFKGEPGRQHW